MRAENSLKIDVHDDRASSKIDRYEVFGPDVAVLTRKVALEFFETLSSCILHNKQGK